jgi:hypothetical protein
VPQPLLLLLLVMMYLVRCWAACCAGSDAVLVGALLQVQQQLRQQRYLQPVCLHSCC